MRAIQVTFHGFEETHDAFVGLENGFKDVCSGARLINSHGLQCEANVFIHKKSAPQVTQMIELLRRLDIRRTRWMVPIFLPTNRLRKYEQHRVLLRDVVKHAGQIAAFSEATRDYWSRLHEYTESAYHKQALASTDDSEWVLPQPLNQINIVCTANLDVFAGQAGLYGRHFGNLAQDGVAMVFTRVFNEAIAVFDRPHDRLFFKRGSIPPVSVLAKAVGKPECHKIYFDKPSIRYRWAAQYLRSQAVYAA